jgi:hypothetical protein
MKRQTLTMEQVLALSPMLGPLIVSTQPEATDAAVELLTALYAQYAKAQAATLEDVEIPVLRKASARKAIAELRETGKASVALPYLCENRPRVKVLKPYTEIVVCWGSGDIQSARSVFPCEWFTEAELTATATAENWDAEWLKQALASKGKRSAWTWDSLTQNVNYIVQNQDRLQLIEIAYGYSKVVDDDGGTVIRRVTFCPAVKGLYAISEDLEHLQGEYPFAEIRREQLGRMVTETRGISQIAGPWQDEEKTHTDALGVYAELSTTPPIQGPKLGFNFRFGPGGYVADTRPV